MAPNTGSAVLHVPLDGDRALARRVTTATPTRTDETDSGKGRSMSVSILPESISAEVVGEPAFLNPWRELDRDAFVIAYAMKGTARCGACQTKVAKGELQLGAFYAHEDKFTLVRWHHQRCVKAPECLTHPMDLCGIEDVKAEDLDRVMKWLRFGPADSAKDKLWTA